MTGFVDSTINDIDARVRELRAELAKLEAARAALLGGGRRSSRSAGSSSSSSAGTTSSSSRSSGTTRRRGGGRRGGNTRAKQALELVQQRPGITIPEIAEAMGIEPNYLYRVMPRLVSEGSVRRDGQGWHPAS